MSELLNQDLTELIVLPEKSVYLTELFATEGALNPFAKIIHDAVAEFNGDASTDKGRKEIKKIGAMINKSRDFIDNKGKEIVAELKDMPKRIDAHRKAFRDDIDALRANKMQPLTDWEDAEKARIDGLKSKLNLLVETIDAGIQTAKSVEAIEPFISRVFADEVDWQDITGDAEATKMQLIKRLNARKEQIIEEDKAIQERIKREVEAQKAKAEADAKAKIEAESQARLKAEQDAINAEKAKAQAEIDAKNADIERERKELEKQREMDAMQKQVEEHQALEAKQAEQKAENERLAREADVKHRGAINSNIKETLMLLGCDESLAIDIVKAMVKGSIKNVSVSY